MHYKVIGKTSSSARDLASSWAKIYDQLDRADIKLSLPASLLPTFADLRYANIEMEANGEEFEGDADGSTMNT